MRSPCFVALSNRRRPAEFVLQLAVPPMMASVADEKYFSERVSPSYGRPTRLGGTYHQSWRFRRPVHLRQLVSGGAGPQLILLIVIVADVADMSRRPARPVARLGDVWDGRQSRTTRALGRPA